MALPIIFPPAVIPQQEADATYFTSVFPPNRTSLSPDETYHSLQEFSKNMSGTKLNELMTRYKKEGVPPNSHQFTLRNLYGKGTHIIEFGGYGKFFMDSERGLALGIKNLKDKNTVWIGVAGIAIGKELDFYNRDAPEESIKGLMNFTYQFPIITQLQGPGAKTYLDEYASANKHSEAIYREAVKALGKYKWERALIDIVLEWAVSQKIPAVYLLPGNMQRWYPDEHKEAYDRRYDVSGQRMGFRMQPNGLYGISLLGALSTT